MTDSKTLKTIDNLIFGFVIIFLLSLTNSIFINQLGYYGALLFILLRYAWTRKNPFRATGLELALVLFILAEILSAIFSAEPGEAFHNVLKRVLLMPIVYTILVSASDNPSRPKLFFKVFIAASVVSFIIYLVNAYSYYISHLYQLKESGPDIFQYPITTSEIMSFAVLFLFAFLVNEKLSLRNKLFVLLLLIISTLALIATYKRTGWMGTAAGIMVIIILKRYWKMLIPVAIGALALLFVEKNISEVYVYKVGDNRISPAYNFRTTGRAYGVYPADSLFYLSDFEEGLKVYKGKETIHKISLPAPVNRLSVWKDSLYLAGMLDTRLILLEKQGDTSFTKKGEFFSPGFTAFYISNGKYLYVMDKDSGLTIFRNPGNLSDTVRIPSIAIYNRIFADSLRLLFHNREKSILIYPMKEGIPDVKPVIYNLPLQISFVYHEGSRVLTCDAAGLKLYSLDNKGNMRLLDEENSIRDIYDFSESGNKLFIAGLSTDIYQVKYPLDSTITILARERIGFLPKSISNDENHLYITRLKQSRLTSIWDPHNPSNATRIAFWKAGIRMFLDHPLFGVGDIDLKDLYARYKNPFDKELQGHLHNNYFHFLAILGAVGFMAAMFLLFKLFSLNLKIYSAVKNLPFASSYALGAVAGFVSFLVQGLTEWNFGDHEIITFIWFTFGLNLAFYFNSLKNDTGSRR